MAIRKDVNDMLNNLKSGSASESPKKPKPKTIPRLSDRRIDNMSVDDIVTSIKNKNEDGSEPPRKKRIVISRELPDYEALRNEELKKQKLENESAEVARLAAERKAVAEEEFNRIADEKRAAEKAEYARREAERQAELARMEAEKKAAEEAEKARREAEERAAREAELARIEAERKAAEEAEIARREAEAKAAREAELARIEAERKAAEEAEIARREAEAKAAREAELARIEAERKAAEEAEIARREAEKKAAQLEVEKKTAEEVELALREAENADTGEKYIPKHEAEIEDTEKKYLPKHEVETTEPAEEPVGENPAADKAAPTVSDSVSRAEELKRKQIEELDRQYIEEMLGLNKEPFWKKLFKKDKNNTSDDPTTPEEPVEKKPGKLSEMLHKILNEDPDEILNQRKVDLESGEETATGGFKKGLYAVFGVIFGVLACIGLVTVIAHCVSKFGSYSSGDSKKEEFESAIYPAVIMDIESFAEPSELPSDQIITAAIWSMIMSDDITNKYEQTFDVVMIPAVDVESAAVKLFGDDLPKLEHATVGPAGSQFYYNEETKSYNVPVAPVTYTYAPEVREATKSGSEYTVAVDYIDELPSWLPKTSSKSVEYVLIEDNGGYRIRSMKITSTSTSGV